MRSTTSGRSWSTSARRASTSGAFTWTSVTAHPRCAADAGILWHLALLRGAVRREQAVVFLSDRISGVGWQLPEDRRHDETDAGHAHDDRRQPPDDVEKTAVGPLAHRRAIVRDEHDEDEERRGDQAVEHRAPDEGGDRVDLEDGDDHPDERGRDDDNVELRRPGELVIEPRSPAERLGHAIGRRTRENGHGQHAGPNEPDGEQERGRVAGKRAQRLGGIGGRGDIGLARHEQRGARGEDDEVGHDLREDHPRHRVPQGVLELEPRSSLALPEVASPDADLLLHLLAGLPEEEVWRDGRAQERDDDADAVSYTHLTMPT